jgi:hypothetical protein
MLQTRVVPLTSIVLRIGFDAEETDSIYDVQVRGVYINDVVGAWLSAGEFTVTEMWPDAGALATANASPSSHFSQVFVGPFERVSQAIPIGRARETPFLLNIRRRGNPGQDAPPVVVQITYRLLRNQSPKDGSFPFAAMIRGTPKLNWLTLKEGRLTAKYTT